MSDTSLQAEIGYRVKRRRMALGWNQTELAARMHIPQGHISRLERGKYAALNPEKLVTLAQALSTTTDYLLGLSDHPGTIEPIQGDGEEQERHGNPAPAVSPTPDVSHADTAAARRKATKTAGTRRAKPRSMGRKDNGQA